VLRWEEGAVEDGKGSVEVLIGRGGAAIIVKLERKLRRWHVLCARSRVHPFSLLIT
jgi:hypothetical protein